MGHLRNDDQIRSLDSDDKYDSNALHAESPASSKHSIDSLGDHYLLDDQDSVRSETSSGYEHLRVSLLGDYDICLGRLQAMQAIIEGALRKLSAASAERSNVIARETVIREVDENGRETLLCLEKHLVNSISHRKIMRKGNQNPRRPAEPRTSRSSRFHEPMRSGTGKLHRCPP
jgi:hypothetical protein